MKRYKGSEIIKKVEEKEIKDGTKIKSDDGDIFTYNADDSTFYWEKNVGGERVPIYTFLNHTFELIEDNNIDIKELWGNCVGDSNQCRDDFMLKNRAKINELVRKYNELNKEIKELKER